MDNLQNCHFMRILLHDTQRDYDPNKLQDYFLGSSTSPNERQRKVPLTGGGFRGRVTHARGGTTKKGYPFG